MTVWCGKCGGSFTGSEFLGHGCGTPSLKPKAKPKP